MRSSANTRSYQKSQKGADNCREGAVAFAGAALSGTRGEDSPLLASSSGEVAVAADRYSTLSSGIRERRKSPKTTPSMEDYGGCDGGGGQSSDEQHNEYVMYREQQATTAQQQQHRQPSTASGRGEMNASYMNDSHGSAAGPSHPSSQPSIQYSQPSQHNHRAHQQTGEYYEETSSSVVREQHHPVVSPAPLMHQANEEVLAVRRAALTVLSPLTYTWLIVTIGFSTTIGLGMARWTNVLPDIPYWTILLPSWLSHVGLLCCHILSAKALSTFIGQANENRQRQDSTDHLDRTEYLPLLQQSLKFGLKTGLLSFCIFVFEVLVYLRLVRGNMSLGAAFTPIWIIVVAGFLDGIICKTQHFIRVVCWALLFASMVLAVLKIDHDFEDIRWRVVISPIVAMLSISAATLIYTVYGHQVGYYRLSEAQLTAGILYSMATLISILLVAAMSEFLPDVNPSTDLQMYIVVLAPLVMVLVGMGGWSVSRDELERLLQYGGQAAVHPMKLRLERQGWTAVETKGVATLPMFGEVSYAPLAKRAGAEFGCCSCYPFEEEDEIPLHGTEGRYIPSVSSQTSSRTGEAAAAGPRGVL